MTQNKLIAEFMGLKLKPNECGRLFRYHKSWGWLMPVVAKCREESNPEDSHWEKIYYSLKETDINVTHSAVVEFIKNYKTI